MPFSTYSGMEMVDQIYYVNDKVSLLNDIDVYVKTKSCSRTLLLLGYKGRIDKDLNKAMRGVCIN